MDDIQRRDRRARRVILIYLCVLSVLCVVRYSHSMVDGGFELMSYTTRLMPFTSFTMRDEMRASRSCGRRAQSAVMPSRLSTARIAAVYSYVRSSPITPTLCTGSSTAKLCQSFVYQPSRL